MLGQGTKLVTPFIFVFVSLHVTNGQDNHPPTFSKSSSPYYAEIAENNDIGTIVLQVTAMDVDVNDTLSYKLHTGTEDFTIDGNGTITANIIFDREVTSSYQITVEVTDGMSWPFIVQALVHVQIIDQNDNRPEFKNMPYEVTLSESTSTGQKVLTTVATDADIGTNSRVQYRIISGDKDGLFSVSHYWGVLTLEKSLDYESMPSDYALTVEAFDWGTPSLSSHANIVIHIKDADDQGPEFSQSLYWKEIKEDVAIGSSVLTVSAFDKDKGTGQNHAVAYSILSGNNGNAFTINASTGELKVNSLLDMEALSRYTLILEASELDSNQSPVNATIVIIVLDVNDNPPAFQSKNYSTSLLENAQIGAYVIQVIAEDNDMDVANRKIRYGFKQSDSKRLFSIDSVSGVITLNSQVDYESGITSHKFQVTATNLAAPSASDTTTVVVNIVDINDNNPVFQKRVFVGQQNENTASDTVIVQVLASDADSNSFCQLTYSIVDGNADGRFEINRTAGKIRNKLILDREQQDLYTLTVQAEDCGTHSRTDLAIVKVIVTDINDNAPIFREKTLKATLTENNQVGTLIASFMATDADIGTNSVLTFKIVAGNSLDAFNIPDSTLGIVTTQISLDYELIQVYNLTIEVRDGGPSGGLADNATLTVYIQNENDNTPVFVSSSYNFSVPENQAINTVIGTISASDADGDSFSFGKVSYSVAGECSNRFKIDSSGGQITVAAIIDREDTCGEEYHLLAIAEDNAVDQTRRTTAEVTVHILDENDNSPTFSHTSYSTSITEESFHPDFITVTATDPDKGNSGKVTYSITEGDTDSIFSIDASTGIISATSKPDREGLRDRYMLTVTASDGAKPPRTDTATVMVLITDINDNDPVFDLTTYRCTISEDVTIGHEVVSVRATDKDVGLSAVVSYAITIGTPSKHNFSIDTGTGSVTTRGTFDYESGLHSYSLTVTATDRLGREGNCSVLITITDSNDNPPVFTQAIYRKSISENLPTTTSVISVLATDGDTGSAVNKELVYSIISGADNIFTIDATTGNISILTPPDYETKKLYTLRIKAQDQASPFSSRLSGTAQVEITITDENDNAPAFAHPYALKVGEGSTVGEMVGCVSASDPDDPDVNGNGLVTYSLTGSDVDDFAIGNISGEISVSRPLDYEARSAYHLTVVATDGGGRKGSTSLGITVIDINDNPPEFSQTNYWATLDENVPLSFPVLQVSASDKDTTRVITYSLSGGDGHFRMIPTTGEVQTAKLIDFEEARQYTFHVTAKDNGAPPRQSSVPVNVAVQDMNDNKPQFTQSTYSATVQEELPDGQSIAKVFAIDKDSSSNGAVSYAIVDGIGKDRFVINSTTGDVATTTPLDRENQTSYRLTLQARDSGSPCRVANATLTVIVQDINDNAPYFDPSSYATVSLSEDTAISTKILTVTARDNDIGVNQKIFYSLSGDGGRFRMNRTTGELTTAASLNRETKMDYALRITASDSGLHSRSVTLNVDVTVTDVNDNAPDFTQSSYSGVILEGAAKGSFILTVSATDSDHGDNGLVVYSIVGGNEGGEFRVTASGEVQATTIKLDRETKSSYTLTVQATDKGSPPKSTTVLLQVTVTDANDNNPIFTARTYGSTISEQAVIGTTLLAVTATDRDTGLNGAFRYSFANPHSVIVKSFSIDPSSGHITTTKSLNAEKVKQYTFEVRATDKGVPSLSSYAKVVVQVSDVNDNDPVFNETKYRPEVYENEPSGTWVATVLATEKDANDSGKVTYTISYGDANEKFQIDPISGVITTRDSLDRESVPFYTLTVTATDNGIPPRSGQTMVEVIVLDRNDQSPKCEFNLYTKTIAEGTAAIGTVAAIVSASDGDLGPNRNGNSDGIFSIADPSVGNVTTVKAMDREAKPNVPAYTLTITATDQGQGRLTGTTKVQISISDINDNSPQFIDSPYSAAIAESLTNGSCVLQVNATDIDTGKNAEIVYKLVAATPAIGLIHFDLDDNSGLLRIKPVSLDFETFKYYKFEVSASDKGSPALTANTTISVSIIDVNDNIPVFPDKPYNQTLAEGETSFCVTIVRVSAIDLDSGLYGTVRYSITSGNAAVHFAIDPSTGLVTTMQSLDFESKRSYELTVTAHDQNGTGDPLTRHSASTMVLVTLTDINDNAPEFDSASYVEDVSESSLIGVEVVTLTANDDDSGSNAAVVYNIAKGNTGYDFTIDPVTGKITVAKSLDIERTIHYDLEVVAKDKGTPSLYATVTVRIDVVDTNDDTTHTSSAFTTSVGQALLCFTVMLGTSFG